MQEKFQSKMRPMLVSSIALLGAVALSLGGTAAASAHVGASTNTNEAGSYAVVTISVPHGCDVAPTTQIAIQIPDGVNAVTPTRNNFYTIEKVMEVLETPITDSHGNEITERVAEVVYTATTPLPADQRDVFELSLQIPEEAADSTLYFPTVQSCEEGESAWVQIPADGQDPHELELPAPAIEVVSAVDSGQSHAASGEAAPAASEAETAGNSQAPLVIASLVIGALGLTTGVTALVRGRKKA